MLNLFTGSNTLKFLLGSLAGAVLMMLWDMNSMFVQLELQSPSSLRRVTFSPSTSSLKHHSFRLRITASSSKEATFESVNPFVEKMENNSLLSQSALQCASVWRKKDALPTLFDRERRFDTAPGDFAATVLSDKWAFLHVWANGHKTVIKVAEDQLKETQRRKDFAEIKNRKWMALVQEPIKHFLEGWAMAELKMVEEVKGRGHDDLASKIIASWEAPDTTYDDRVSEFLDRVLAYSTKQTTAQMSPLMHALPQTNFLMDGLGFLHPNLAIIGELNEWKGMMELVGFQGNPDKTMLDATPILRAKYFPSRMEGLSRNTIIRLCDFLAMDYYLLSYDAPLVCLQKLGPLDFPHRRRLQQRKLQHEEGEYS